MTGRLILYSTIIVTGTFVLTAILLWSLELRLLAALCGGLALWFTNLSVQVYFLQTLSSILRSVKGPGA